jgi:hypothetical protein
MCTPCPVSAIFTVTLRLTWLYMAPRNILFWSFSPFLYRSQIDTCRISALSFVASVSLTYAFYFGRFLLYVHIFKMTTRIIVLSSSVKENIIKKSTFLFWRIKLLIKLPLLHCRLSIMPYLPDESVGGVCESFIVLSMHSVSCFQILFAPIPIVKSHSSPGRILLL